MTSKRGTFTDQDGRSWLCAINIATVRSLKDRIGLDVMSAFEGKLFSELASDPVKLGDALYVICEQQARDRGISDWDFGCLLAGDTLDRATDALIEAIIDFFPGSRREILSQIWNKQRQADRQVTAAALRRVNSSAMDRMIEKAVSEAELEFDRAMMSGDGSGSQSEQSE